MIKIKTKLGLSTKKGIGLFADENIPKGSVVGINTDNLSIVRYSEKDWENLKENLTEESFKHIKKYAYKNKDDGLYWLNLDNTRFINHSDDPNIATIGDNDVAIKDIKINDEILIDYKTFYDPDYFEEIMMIQ